MSTTLKVLTKKFNNKFTIYITMLNWLFKKRGSELEHIHKKLDYSFSRIREDMNSVGKWIHHFKSKHDDHEKMFRLIMAKLQRMESKLASLESLPEQTKEEIEMIEEPEMQLTAWDSLTETHQKICWQLASIQKELPNQWISLKYLAQEMYPDKSYNQVRSTLSQYISSLEELGYVKRIRKGKQAYVYSTPKNPCMKKKKKIFSVLSD
jgi:Sec-independent protein translocase protein TatA